MFQDFDATAAAPPPARAGWMAVLARAPLPLMETALEPHLRVAPRWLRAPETGLMMVQGRVGGSGERFNVGEVTVTRCALRLPGASPEPSAVGVAYVLGRSHRRARLAATADALLQDPARREEIEARLLAPARTLWQAEQAERQAQAQASRVEFFTVAREAGGPDEEEDE